MGIESDITCNRLRVIELSEETGFLFGMLGTLVMALSTLSVPLHLVITQPIKRGLLAVVIGVAILRIVYGWTCSKMFAPPEIERSGDQYWRWGLLYYNPSDPTLFIQHRCGPGYTLNFANFLSWPLALAFLADVAFLVTIHLRR